VWRKGAASQDSTGSSNKEKYNQEVQVAAGAMWCIQPRFAHMAGKRLTTMASDLALRHVASGEDSVLVLGVGDWGLVFGVEGLVFGVFLNEGCIPDHFAEIWRNSIPNFGPIP
jgi:hypothetical protein